MIDLNVKIKKIVSNEIKIKNADLVKFNFLNTKQKR